MHEKTLLYSALFVTAVAGTLGVLKERRGSNSQGPAPASNITRLSIGESAPIASTDMASAPIALTASDGSGIALVTLEARAAIEGPLALTEIRLVFENPEDRVREGTFRMTLPQGASLSRFAMKVADVWQEGEVVERQAARRAYEDFLHRRQDPALLEQAGGNEFTARVFPIPARGRKELVLTYSEVLNVGAPFTIPLKGLPSLSSLDVDVHSESSSFGLHKTKYAPPEDFTVPEKELPHVAGLRSGELAVARIVPFGTSRPEPIASAVVLVDTSASRALGIREQAEEVRAVLAKLGEAKVSVAAFDQEVVPIHAGAAASFGEAGAKRLVDRGALGGSNLEKAIAWAGTEAKRMGAKRIVLVTDGVATAGETDAQKLRVKVEALRAAGIARLDAIAIGGIRDEALLRTIARGVLDKDGVVLDGKQEVATIARRLGEATTSGIPVVVEGASWSWPTSLDGLQAGDPVVVFAKTDAKGSEGPLKVKIGAQELSLDLRKADRPLVERAVAQAEIQGLVEKPSKSPDQTKKDIVTLSTRHRVLSPHTALLVLETDADYTRFGIDRTAKLDILTVDKGRIAVTQAGRGSLAKNVEGEKSEKKDFAFKPSPPVEEGRSRRDEEPAPALAPAPAAAAPAMESAPVDLLNAAAGGAAGVATGNGDLRVGSGGSPVQGGGGKKGQGLAGLGGGTAGQGEGAGTPAKVAGPVGIAQLGGATVTGGTITDVDRVAAGLRARFRACYRAGLSSDPSMTGKLVIEATVGPNGEVTAASATRITGISKNVADCISGTVKRALFDAPGREVKVSIPISLIHQTDGTTPSTQPTPVPEPTASPTPAPTPTPPQPDPNAPKPAEAKPYDGNFKIVMDAIDRHDGNTALREALAWRSKSSGDVLALVGLGEALEAKGDTLTAARAYGSIFELFSARADSRRFAGERLEHIATPFALELAIDTYEKAVAERPDHPASHRLYAFALVKAGRFEKAFDAIVAGATRTYPGGRFAGVDRILREDVGLVAAAWIKAVPARRAEIEKRREAARGYEENGPSLRFVLVWETDANDVDFHIHDGKGGHAYYRSKSLPSGGELYADVTTGYGPECFTIRGAREERAYPYMLQAHYYSRGPMGYGMGKLQVIEHDGNGGLVFDERPFIVMVDRAFVDLGTVDAPKR